MTRNGVACWLAKTSKGRMATPRSRWMAVIATSAAFCQGSAGSTPAPASA